MYQVISGTTRNLADTATFIAQLPEDFFAAAGDITVSRAPGRLDVMGGIADYCGTLALPWPIAEATHTALQLRPDATLNILSWGQTGPLTCTLSLEELAAMDYATARAWFAQKPARHWASYVAGVWLVLQRECGIKFRQGANVLISSDIPPGQGVSSSAALEVATIQAVTAAYGIALTPLEAAFLCQKVENLVAGAPCGVLDQMASLCGVEGALLELLCQPCDLRGTVRLPAELAVWGLDSGVRHAVGGGDYGTVRTAAFMGYRILADVAGLPCYATETLGRVQIDDTRWRGYLANVTSQEFAREFAAHLPETMSGVEFLQRYQGITDTVTTVQREKNYPVLAATRHPVEENARVHRFAEILQNWHGGADAEALGALMYAAHESYTACGLGAAGTDELVALARAEADLYGAKITGGGSGGTVAVLGRRDALAAVRRVATKYAKQTGYVPFLFAGSSPGANSFGTLRLKQTSS